MIDKQLRNYGVSFSGHLYVEVQAATAQDAALATVAEAWIAHRHRFHHSTAVYVRCEDGKEYAIRVRVETHPAFSVEQVTEQCRSDQEAE